MSAHSQALGSTSLRPRPAFSLRRWTEREGVFSWLMVIPPVLFLVALVGYPFVYGIWLSLEDRPVAKPGMFIGLGNFITDLSMTRCSGRWRRTRSSIRSPRPS